MEIAKGIHRIEAPLGNRVMYQHLIIDEDQLILIDTGIAATPEQIIFPYLISIGKRPEDITDIVITHADADHCGGNEAVKRTAPNAKLWCHALDRSLIEDPDRMMQERYDEFAAEGVRYAPEVRSAMRQMMGAPVAADGVLSDGDVIHLSDERSMNVYHVPGHSPGHLMLFDPLTTTAIITDAALGDGLLDEEGSIMFPPTYRNPDAYLHSLARIESLQPSLLLTTHYPVIQASEVTQFLRKSRLFTATMEAALTVLLKDEWKSLQQLMQEVFSYIAQWPQASNIELKYALTGTLESMTMRNMLREDEREGCRVWTREK